MSLFETINSSLNAARKAGEKEKLSILTVLFGELQTLQFSKGHAPTISDEEAVKVIKKIIEGNTQTINLSPNNARNADLEREITVLSAFLPKMASKEEIRTALGEAKFTNVQSEGQAIGLAIKYLKSQGILAESKDVIEIVKEMANVEG
jgi:uncharacterized protein